MAFSVPLAVTSARQNKRRFEVRRSTYPRSGTGTGDNWASSGATGGRAV